jgi:ABC-type uncharacterized transport system auxiliary subunit
MNSYFTRLFVVLGTTAIWGCAGFSSRPASPSLYLIDHAATLLPVVADSVEALPYRVRVRDFHFPRVLDRTRIVYRYSPNRLNYYRLHQWAIPPRTMVSDVVARHLVAASVFREVRRQFIDQQPDLEIRGDLGALERFENGDYGGAHLAMELRLQRRADGALLARHEFDRRVRLQSGSMTFFAQTISTILEEETAVFIQKIWESFDIHAETPWIAPAAPDSSAVTDRQGYRLVPLPVSRRSGTREDAS